MEPSICRRPLRLTSSLQRSRELSLVRKKKCQFSPLPEGIRSTRVQALPPNNRAFDLSYPDSGSPLLEERLVVVRSWDGAPHHAAQHHVANSSTFRLARVFAEHPRPRRCTRRDGLFPAQQFWKTANSVTVPLWLAGPRLSVLEARRDRQKALV